VPRACQSSRSRMNQRTLEALRRRREAHSCGVMREICTTFVGVRLPAAPRSSLASSRRPRDLCPSAFALGPIDVPDGVPVDRRPRARERRASSPRPLPSERPSRRRGGSSCVRSTTRISGSTRCEDPLSIESFFVSYGFAANSFASATWPSVSSSSRTWNRGRRRDRHEVVCRSSRHARSRKFRSCKPSPLSSEDVLPLSTRIESQPAVRCEASVRRSSR
jgi:hypothetical protein